MSFNRSGYIGRAPGDSSVTISKQYFQPTGVTTDFTFSSGYDPGLIDVYRNGIKLINVLDYAATDGSTISLSTPVGVGSTVQVVAYKAFNAATVKATELDTTVTGTTINLSGDITATNATISALTTTENLSVSAAATVSSAFYVGSALTANAAGDVETIGIITASSFSGDGTGLSGVVGVGTLNVRTESLTVSGVSTLTGVANFSAAVNVDATTDSTSTSTGALIVDGGLGVAKNVYIGAGLSVAGTLTYEDVTSVDSVGMVTAKSGVNITGGQLTVGSGITMGIAGVATFSGTADIHLRDNVKLNVGDSTDLSIYHDGSGSYIKEAGTGQLYLQADNLILENAAGANYLVGMTGAEVILYHNDQQKFQTTYDGTVTTGISTATGGLSINADNKKLTLGTDEDLRIYHSGSTNFIEATTHNIHIDLQSGNENAAKFIQNGAVELYHNGSKTFETTGTGATVSTSSGDAFFEISCAGQANLNLKTTSGSDHCSINFGDHADHDIGEIRYTNSSDQLSFDVGGTTNAIIVGPAGITTFTTTPSDDLGKLRDIPLRSVTGSQATLVLTDAGKVVSTNTTGWVVPALSWVAGNTVSLLNNSAGDLTITCSAVTTYLTSDGSTVTSSTLGARGMATLYFVSSSVAYLQGTALS